MRASDGRPVMSSIGRPSAACSAASAYARAGVIAESTWRPFSRLRSCSTRRTKSALLFKPPSTESSRICLSVVTVHRRRSALFGPCDDRIGKIGDQRLDLFTLLVGELAEDMVARFAGVRLANTDA